MADLYLDEVWDKNPFKMYQVMEEMNLFFRMLADRKPVRMLEIGILYGGTTFLFANALQDDGMLISIDKDLPAIYHQFLPYVAAVKRIDIHLLRTDSHSARTPELVKTLLQDRPLDALFIDGDHSYDGVKQDFKMYSPLVRSGGIIGLHDIVDHPTETNCQVNLFWKNLLNNPDYEHTEIINDRRQGKCGIGVLFKK